MSNMNGSRDGGKVLARSRDNRIIAGVCAGAAEYLGMDVNLVRILAALVTFFTGIVGGVVVYLVAWAVIPEEGQKSSIAQDLIDQNKRR